MIVKEIKRQEYDDYLENLRDYSFLQRSEMGEALKVNGRDIRLLGLVDGEEILAVGLGFIRKFYEGKRLDFMVGASSHKKEYEYIFYDKLRAYAKDEGFLKLVVKLDETIRTYDQEGDPLTAYDESFSKGMKEAGFIDNDGSVPEYDGSPDFQFVKDLKDFMPDDEEALLKSYNKNAQRKIKKARELGLRVRRIDKSELDDFKTITKETADRQGFGDKAIAYYETFYEEYGKDCDFLTTEINFDYSIRQIEEILEEINESPKNKQRIKSLENDIAMLKDLKAESPRDIMPLANMILIYEDREAVYFLGGSLTDYQKLPGAFILQHEAMLRTMERGISFYNFFGIDGVYDGSDGVLRFKQNFNGYVEEKTGAFIYYPYPEKLDEMKKARENS